MMNLERLLFDGYATCNAIASVRLATNHFHLLNHFSYSLSTSITCFNREKIDACSFNTIRFFSNIVNALKF